MKILLQNSGKYIFLFLILIIFSSAPVFAQDGFGFGETEDNFGFGETEDNFGFGEAENNFGFGESSSSSFSIDIGGKVSAGFTAFFDDFSSGDSFKEIRLGDIFSGNLDFRAGGTHAEAIINIKIVPVFDGTSPITLDESFLRTFFSPVTLEGGLRKISWGRADSFGPLDIINPLDYTNMTKLSDPKSIKIARPMFRALWSMGSFTRLDAVFLPVFKGHKFASSGRWAPSQVNELKNLFERYLKVLSLTSENSELIQAVGNEYLQNLDIEDLYPDTAKLEYAQAGMRFTTSFGSSDFGFQYYFGRFHRPVVGEIDLRNLAGTNFNDIMPSVIYNYYHQIGADFARVIAGFNLRMEAGANLTKDLDGTDGEVENPALVWSLGFDRDLFWQINLNLQGSGSVMLFHGKIGENSSFDIEKDKNMSSSRITAILSRKFLRDDLELKVSGLWGIEDRDFLIMPAIIWARNDISAECAAGFFGGDEKGELGQYSNNNYIRLLLSYRF